ncbi:MAG TPA: hypothetical protein DCO77_09770 [Nitrospiraceae bacterium]|nr:hypothetical protein [Nitrospiraceae bacterium]
MSEGTQPSQGSRILFVLAGLVIVVWGIHAAQSVLLPFLVAIFLAVIGASPVIWLEKKRVPSVVAVLLVVAGMVGVLLVMAALVGTSVTAFSDALPLYQKRLQEMTALSLTWLSGMGIDISDKLLLKHVDPGAIMRLIARMLSGLGSALANTFLILITVIFILLEASSFPRKLRTAFRDPHATFPQFSRFADSLRRYLAIKTWISLATGMIIALWLALLGVDFPLLWGLLAFLLNYVPNLGSIIAAAPAVLVALIQLGPGTAVLSAAGYIVVNVVLGNAVEPKLMGRGLGLSTLVVFLSLIFWGSLLGPVGMILSVPITMTLKIALESSEQTRWIAVMLGTGEPVD